MQPGEREALEDALEAAFGRPRRLAGECCGLRASSTGPRAIGHECPVAARGIVSCPSTGWDAIQCRKLPRRPCRSSGPDAGERIGGEDRRRVAQSCTVRLDRPEIGHQEREPARLLRIGIGRDLSVDARGSAASSASRAAAKASSSARRSASANALTPGMSSLRKPSASSRAERTIRTPPRAPSARRIAGVPPVLPSRGDEAIRRADRSSSEEQIEQFWMNLL